MNNKPSQTGKPIFTKRLIVIIVIAAFICATTLLISYATNEYFNEFSQEENEEITDEINRARCFISDWFLENSDGNSRKCTVYLNELRFEQGRYTLTFAGGDRIRATSPRGERFFKFEYINNIEFFEVDEKVRCRLYYGRSGEYTFTV